MSLSVWYKHIEFLSINNHIFAFDPTCLYAIRLDKELFVAYKRMKDLERIDLDEYSPYERMHIVMNARKGYFFSSEPVKVPDRQTAKFTPTFSFAPLHACNAKCIYCFTQTGKVYSGINKISTVTVKKAIDFMIKRFPNNKVFRLEFVSGGEPLLDSKHFLSIINTVRICMNKCNHHIKIHLVTNGVLLTEQIISFILTNNISIAFSLDGDETLHNIQRPLMNMKNGYKLTCDAINKMVLNSQKMNLSYHLWIISVITLNTKSLVSLLLHHKGIGAKTVEMRIVRGSEEVEFILNKKNITHFTNLYDELAQYFLKDFENGYIENFLLILNTYDTFGKLIIRVLLQNIIIYRCDAGRTKIAFAANGDVYPCDSFMGNDEYIMGNIYKDEWNEEKHTEFLNASIINNSLCKNCCYRYMCGGDCNYNIFANSSSISHNKSSASCELSKYLCNWAIYLTDILRTKYKNMYETVQKFVRVRQI